MCTAAAYNCNGLFFGRTLDSDVSYGEEAVITPSGFPFSFRRVSRAQSLPRGGIRHAIVGAAAVVEGYPLYFDGMNDAGLCMAGLNFKGNARYNAPQNGKINLAQYELLPYLLGKCESVAEAREELAQINITPDAFSAAQSPAELHWLIAGKGGCIAAECTEGGMKVYDNAAGVLTNNPPFDCQMIGLANYMSLSAARPVNNFGDYGAEEYGAGLGAFGLPGDYSPMSRFVRAAFVRANIRCGDGEADGVLALFDILNSVRVPRGCCRSEGGEFYTQYSCCCSAESKTYYFTRGACRTPFAVSLNTPKAAGEELVRFSMGAPVPVNKLNF